MAPMTRTVTLVLLGGAALTTCCCLLRPPPPPQQYDENGNPVAPAAGSSGTARSTTYRRSPSWWVPVFWGGTSGRSYTPPYRSGGGSPSRSPSPGGAVTRGGFGGTGKAITSGASS